MKTACLTVLSWLQYVGVSRASGVRAPWNGAVSEWRPFGMAAPRNGGPSEWRPPTVSMSAQWPVVYTHLYYY